MTIDRARGARIVAEVIGWMADDYCPSEANDSGEQEASQELVCSRGFKFFLDVLVREGSWRAETIVRQLQESLAQTELLRRSEQRGPRNAVLLDHLGEAKVEKLFDPYHRPAYFPPGLHVVQILKTKLTSTGYFVIEAKIVESKDSSVIRSRRCEIINMNSETGLSRAKFFVGIVLGHQDVDKLNSVSKEDMLNACSPKQPHRHVRVRVLVEQKGQYINCYWQGLVEK